MKTNGARRGFSLLELLVAIAITLTLAATLLAVTTATLNLWRRTQDNFTTATQARLVLDYLERDLQAALFRADGHTWLAIDIINPPASLTTHGWLTTTMMKPNSTESQLLAPPAVNGVSATIADSRFGLSGAWLRFNTSNVETSGSLPIAVSYQIARRPLSGTNLTATNLAEVRYSLFRSAIAADTTFATGHDVLIGYGSGSSTPQATRNTGTLTNPNPSDLIATDAVDFGVWLYARDVSGELTRLFPTSNSTFTWDASASGNFPVVADVMVRILTEEGAKLVAAMENGAMSRPDEFATDAAWWWAVVEANSRVVVRRIEMKAML